MCPSIRNKFYSLGWCYKEMHFVLNKTFYFKFQQKWSMSRRDPHLVKVKMTVDLVWKKKTSSNIANFLIRKPIWFLWVSTWINILSFTTGLYPKYNYYNLIDLVIETMRFFLFFFLNVYKHYSFCNLRWSSHFMSLSVWW